MADLVIKAVVAIGRVKGGLYQLNNKSFCQDKEDAAIKSYGVSLRKSTRNVSKPGWLNDFVVSSITSSPINSSETTADLLSPSSVANVYATMEPKTYQQACKDNNWVITMKAELDALENNNTWILTSQRLVAKGHNQLPRVNHHDSFSLVAKLVIVKVFLAIGTAFNWAIHQLDINNAYPHGHIDEDLYMLPPKGYTKA
ncbi:hypothetical protein GH714_042378 [Hevea brasiliensis]|uniref:Reverse transcriptase Ty1/copia-type domain-containing protein n=1 Tax=Hevea brasiliensis TaxID=3981 RepID=A0A6A6KMQ7_HEVBR|nr:hypothetical protein GH714_042378 [Hevea brasiliensis]